MPEHHFLAFDLGAESGRAMLGTLLNRKKLVLKEIHRFRTKQLRIDKHYYWNIFGFYEEMVAAVVATVKDHDIIPESVGVDTWGVDFGLLGKDGSILRIPYGYRDPMTETAMPSFHEKMSREKVYKATGIATLKFNTLYQLYAMKMADDPVLGIADKLLFIPDLLNYLLSGEIKSEFTFATTSQLFNPHKMNWESSLFKALDIDKSIMPEVVRPGTKIGELTRTISRKINVEGISVMAVTSHDTASAIASVPSEGEEWAYISSGTWSLMGVETRNPIINQQSLTLNFTNEGGADGTFRFLKNIMGLWLLQQCRNSWEKTDRLYSYEELVRMAKEATPFSVYIDPDFPGFYNPLDMPSAIDTFCRNSGQKAPGSVSDYTRTILEGLALKYRMVLEQLQLVTGNSIRVIYIIGGGAKNDLLCQFAANATGRKVVTGPGEATAIGNILIQASGLGYIGGLEDVREIVRNSFGLKTYEPEETEIWDDAYENFLKVAKQS